MTNEQPKAQEDKTDPNQPKRDQSNPDAKNDEQSPTTRHEPQKQSQ